MGFSFFAGLKRSDLPGIVFRLMLLVVACGIFTSSASADLRVLIKFDELGHQLHRVVQVNQSGLQSSNVQSRSAFASSPVHGSLVWLDEAGQTLLQAMIVDPRVTHAPLVENEASPTFLSIDSGAYMVQGPDDSAVLHITLPANAAVGLSAESWSLNLAAEN